MNFIGDNAVVIDGIKTELPKPVFKNHIKITCINNNKVYCNFKEFKNGEWVVTIKSILYYLFK